MSILLIMPLPVARFLGNETETCVCIVAIKRVSNIVIKTVPNIKHFRKKAQKAGHPLYIG